MREERSDGQNLSQDALGAAPREKYKPAQGRGRPRHKSALLSHYENGTREPGLAFVCRVCDYYGVTADYLLCRSSQPAGDGQPAEAARIFIDRLRGIVSEAERALTGPELKTGD